MPKNSKNTENRTPKRTRTGATKPPAVGSIITPGARRGVKKLIVDVLTNPATPQETIHAIAAIASKRPKASEGKISDGRLVQVIAEICVEPTLNRRDRAIGRRLINSPLLLACSREQLWVALFAVVAQFDGQKLLADLAAGGGSEEERKKAARNFTERFCKLIEDAGQRIHAREELHP